MRPAAAALVLFAATWAIAARADVQAARFSEPTTRYDHAILGDNVEWGALELAAGGATYTLRLPESRVFEDLAPRLADVDGDGDNEVIVVETDLAKGAQLALYDETGKIAATPFIGQSHRWLAPAGVGDLDGDGRVELAYIDRPHLAKRLRVWRYENGELSEVAALDGLTNHRIGWDFIAGGLRDCGAGPELLLASGDWRELVAVRLRAGVLDRETLAPLSSLADFDRALACQ